MSTPSPHPLIHPAWLRAMHWLNALAVVVLMMSGWRIYNATAFLGFAIPADITLGGWLGGALQWHFAAMWVLGINGLLYLLLNAATGRLTAKFFVRGGIFTNVVVDYRKSGWKPLPIVELRGLESQSTMRE